MRSRYNIWTILWLELMFVTPVLVQLFMYGKQSLVAVVIAIIAALPLAMLLAAIRRYWIFVLVTVPLMYFCGNETFVVVVYQNYMHAANVISMFITTGAESGSFVSNNLMVPLFDVPVIVFWICALVAHRRYLRLGQKCERRYFVTAVCLLVVALLLQGSLHEFLFQPPYNLPFQYLCAAKQTYDKKVANEESRKLTMGARHKGGGEREIYVMTIGESLRYDRLSLSGYGRKTTPQLDSTRNVELFTDYYSNSTLTMLSTPMMMSCARPETFMTAYSRKNIISAFRECGFKVYVLVCLNHLDADEYLTYDADSVFHLAKDMDIPRKIDSLASIPENRKLFFVTQGLGSHGYYYNFEKEDNLFGPNPYIAGRWNDSQKKEAENLTAQYSNAYDCTVHYTDRVLKAIIRAIDREGTSSFLLFASDHGENLEDGAEKRSVSMNPQKTEYHVPLIFWYSDSWAEHNRGKLQCMLAHKDRPVGADNFYHTFVDLADIRLPKSYYSPDYSIASQKFKTHERHLLCPDGRTVIGL